MVLYHTHITHNICMHRVACMHRSASLRQRRSIHIERHPPLAYLRPPASTSGYNHQMEVEMAISHPTSPSRKGNNMVRIGLARTIYV